MNREEALAETVVGKYGLRPPVDVLSLAKRFADVEYDSIPGSCDGLVLGLDGRGTRPLILVERSDHPTRQRFTLAHELGHLLLPWHLGGAFACDTATDHPDFSPAANFEPEANRFAAELLLPSAWLDALISSRHDEKVGNLVRNVLDAGVSTWVASFRLTERLPRGHVFAVVDSGDGKVVLSGETRGTGIGAPPQGVQLDRDRLDSFASEVEEVEVGSRRVIWWTYRGQADNFTAPEGDSRLLLKELAQRHGTSSDSARQLVQRCNGIVGFAYDTARREGETNAAHLYAVLRGRFAKKRGFPAGLLEDPEFDAWLRLRAAELGNQPGR